MEQTSLVSLNQPQEIKPDLVKEVKPDLIMDISVDEALMEIFNIKFNQFSQFIRNDGFPSRDVDSDVELPREEVIDFSGADFISLKYFPKDRIRLGKYPPYDYLEFVIEYPSWDIQKYYIERDRYLPIEEVKEDIE